MLVSLWLTTMFWSFPPQMGGSEGQTLCLWVVEKVLTLMCQTAIHSTQPFWGAWDRCWKVSPQPLQPGGRGCWVLWLQGSVTAFCSWLGPFAVIWASTSNWQGELTGLSTTQPSPVASCLWDAYLGMCSEHVHLKGVPWADLGPAGEIRTLSWPGNGSGSAHRCS